MNTAKIKEDLKWKGIPYLWTRILNTIRMTVFSKLIYSFNVIPTEISRNFKTTKACQADSLRCI